MEAVHQLKAKMVQGQWDERALQTFKAANESAATAIQQKSAAAPLQLSSGETAPSSATNSASAAKKMTARASSGNDGDFDTAARSQTADASATGGDGLGESASLAALPPPSASTTAPTTAPAPRRSASGGGAAERDPFDSPRAAPEPAKTAVKSKEQKQLEEEWEEGDFPMPTLNTTAKATRKAEAPPRVGAGAAERGGVSGGVLAAGEDELE
jgi:hypothetical protein